MIDYVHLFTISKYFTQVGINISMVGLCLWHIFHKQQIKIVKPAKSFYTFIYNLKYKLCMAIFYLIVYTWLVERTNIEWTYKKIIHHPYNIRQISQPPKVSTAKNNYMNIFHVPLYLFVLPNV
jgi:hypothetical protein